MALLYVCFAKESYRNMALLQKLLSDLGSPPLGSPPLDAEVPTHKCGNDLYVCFAKESYRNMALLQK